MEFTRKRKKGQTQKTCKYWFSDDGYRIIWRNEFYGVAVPARFQAAVRTIIPNYGGEEDKSFEMWDCVSKPRLYRTLKAAQEDCEKHKRLWTKACGATGIRGLIDIFGKLPLSIPVWAKRKLQRKGLEILSRPRTGKQREDDDCEPRPSDPTRTSTCSASLPEVTPASLIHALPAVGDGDSLTPVPHSQTSTDSSNAKPTRQPVKAKKKAAKKPNVKPSKPASGKKRNSRSTSDIAKKPSMGLPRKRTVRSKS